MKKVFVIIFCILVISDIIFEFIKSPILLFVFKNCIPLYLAAILGYFRKFHFTRNDYLLLIIFIFLMLGLNFGYYFNKEKNYIPLILIIYFIEIQLQIKILKNHTNIILSTYKQDFIKIIIIFSLGLFIIIMFFPQFSFINQILLFINVLQHAIFISIVFRNSRLNSAISISLWLLILSDISSLIHMVMFKNPYDYAITMVLVYFSKFYFLIGYLKLKKLISDGKTLEIV